MQGWYVKRNERHGAEAYMGPDIGDLTYHAIRKRIKMYV
jgi:hypothetical protein